MSGDRLPLLRAAAAGLRVNPMMVSKADALLSRDGLLTRRRGAGMFVTDKAVDASKLVRSNLKEPPDAARRLGFPRKWRSRCSGRAS